MSRDKGVEERRSHEGIGIVDEVRGNREDERGKKEEKEGR